jgi:hypothetical protein
MEVKLDVHVPMNIMDHDANLVRSFFMTFDYKICISIWLVNRPKSCSSENPCMNNGKCMTTSTGSQCICEKGTSGVLCERSKFLLNNFSMQLYLCLSSWTINQCSILSTWLSSWWYLCLCWFNSQMSLSPRSNWSFMWNSYV